MDTGFTKEELRTIDALVTVFVMEYPVVLEVPELEEPGASGAPDVSALKTSKRSPPWSCDESLAMKVVKTLIAEGFLATMQGHEKGWTVSLIRDNSLDHCASAATLPLAICLASLRTVGIDRLPTA